MICFSSCMELGGVEPPSRSLRFFESTCVALPEQGTTSLGQCWSEQRLVPSVTTVLKLLTLGGISCGFARAGTRESSCLTEKSFDLSTVPLRDRSLRCGQHRDGALDVVVGFCGFALLDLRACEPARHASRTSLPLSKPGQPRVLLLRTSFVKKRDERKSRGGETADS